jgi:hypothetical protein
MHTMSSAIKLSAIVAGLCLSVLTSAQEVQVSPVKGGVMLSVSAQRSYQLMPGDSKLPVLSVECLHKGKKGSHLVIFAPGGMVGDNNEAGGKGEQSFVLTVNGKKQASTWATYGQPDTFVYLGKTEPERAQFLQSLLGSTVTFEFKPFLTGTPASATFDLSQLREALNKQSECSGE